VGVKKACSDKNYIKAKSWLLWEECLRVKSGKVEGTGELHEIIMLRKKLGQC
jgi:hypothetical protein